MRWTLDQLWATFSGSLVENRFDDKLSHDFYEPLVTTTITTHIVNITTCHIVFSCSLYCFMEVIKIVHLNWSLKPSHYHQ